MIVAERTSVKHRRHTAIAAAEVTTALKSLRLFHILGSVHGSRLQKHGRLPFELAHEGIIVIIFRSGRHEKIPYFLICIHKRLFYSNSGSTN